MTTEPTAAPAVSWSNPVAVEVVRGDLVECVHRARVVVTDPTGAVVAAVGDPFALLYPRSSLKPLQVLAMLELGLDLEGPLLALAGASHNGEPGHLEGVRTILADVGLDETALQNTPDLPLDEATADQWLAAGGTPGPLTQNCSGKHAAMLRTCLRAGHDLSTYLDPEHPLQRRIAATVAELAGTASHPTVDGCGAPLFATTLAGLASAFGALASADDGPRRQVADAYRAHPWYASGTGRLDLALHQRVPGLITKGGAEGCLAIGLSDGTGIALKVDDGATRAVGPLAAAVLSRAGHTGLDELLTSPVRGHGRPVGEVRAVQSVVEELGRAAGW